MGKTIMTVDDSASVRQMVSFTLKNAVPRRETWKSAFLTLLPDAS